MSACGYTYAPTTLDRNLFGPCTRYDGHKGPCAHHAIPPAPFPPSGNHELDAVRAAGEVVRAALAEDVRDLAERLAIAEERVKLLARPRVIVEPSPRPEGENESKAILADVRTALDAVGWGGLPGSPSMGEAIQHLGDRVSALEEQIEERADYILGTSNPGMGAIDGILSPLERGSSITDPGGGKRTDPVVDAVANRVLDLRAEIERLTNERDTREQRGAELVGQNKVLEVECANQRKRIAALAAALDALGVNPEEV